MEAGATSYSAVEDNGAASTNTECSDESVVAAETREITDEGRSMISAERTTPGEPEEGGSADAAHAASNILELRTISIHPRNGSLSPASTARVPVVAAAAAGGRGGEGM